MRFPIFRISSGISLLILAGYDPALAQNASSCAALAGMKIDSAQIGAPSGGAVIASAEIATVAADPAHPTAVSDGITVGEIRYYCKVLGSVMPVDPAAPPVRFEVNLPLQWNGKALQYGGGGTNGVLITGLAPLRDARPDTPVPVARGFATWGTDSGHDNRQLAEPHAFALNREALINMAYAAYKKTHDVGEHIATAFYGRAPAKTYFYGGSEGGREAMVMAQRYPADFDAIVSAVPVVNYTGINLVEARLAQLEQNGGWLQPAEGQGIEGRGERRMRQARRIGRRRDQRL